MKPWQVVLVVVGVLALHLGLFWLIAGRSPLPYANARRIPLPNFVAKEGRWVDAATGEPLVYREYRVSTRLALPDVWMEAPAPEPSPAPFSLTP